MSALCATPHPARAARGRPSPARGEGTGVRRDSGHPTPGRSPDDLSPQAGRGEGEIPS